MHCMGTRVSFVAGCGYSSVTITFPACCFPLFSSRSIFRRIFSILSFISLNCPAFAIHPVFVSQPRNVQASQISHQVSQVAPLLRFPRGRRWEFPRSCSSYYTLHVIQGTQTRASRTLHRFQPSFHLSFPFLHLVLVGHPTSAPRCDLVHGARFVPVQVRHLHVEFLHRDRFVVNDAS